MFAILIRSGLARLCFGCVAVLCSATVARCEWNDEQLKSNIAVYENNKRVAENLRQKVSVALTNEQSLAPDVITELVVQRDALGLYIEQCDATIESDKSKMTTNRKTAAPANSKPAADATKKESSPIKIEDYIAAIPSNLRPPKGRWFDSQVDEIELKKWLADHCPNQTVIIPAKITFVAVKPDDAGGYEVNISLDYDPVHNKYKRLPQIVWNGSTACPQLWQKGSNWFTAARRVTPEEAKGWERDQDKEVLIKATIKEISLDYLPNHPFVYRFVYDVDHVSVVQVLQ